MFLDLKNLLPDMGFKRADKFAGLKMVCQKLTEESMTHNLNWKKEETDENQKIID